MAEPTDAELDAAAERGRLVHESGPCAESVRFGAGDGRLFVEHANGCTVAFPARLVQGLEDASDAELAEVELLGSGYGLHWTARDVDLSVPGIVAGLFGTSAYMAPRAGRATSPAKAAASRSNGAKGGRPANVNRRSGAGRG